MTISLSNSNPVEYNGNGLTLTFSFPWKISASSDLIVGFIVGGTYTLQASSTYSVAGVGNNGGGQVTFNTPPAIGVIVDIRTQTAEIQPTEFANLSQYLPENTTNTCDRLTRMVQDLYRQAYTFGIHGPDQEFVPWSTLPSAAARANTTLGFDSNGLPTIVAQLSTTLTQALFNAFLNTPATFNNPTANLSLASATPFLQTVAELAAGVTPTDSFYSPGDIRRYGAVLDGVTDCTAALIQACAVGGDVFVYGSMALSSASLAALPNSGVAVISGTAIYGVPGFPCTITGSTACNVFYTTDVSDIYFVDFYCKGNGVGTSTTGYFWYMKCTAVATQDASNCRFIRGGLENFAGIYWIYADNTAAVSFAFRRFVCDGSRFTSKSGNAQSPTLITVTASVFGFSGSDTVTSVSTCTDCVVRNCYADGTHLKNFIYFWSGNVRNKAYNNTLVGFGTGVEFTNDTGAYALAAYDHSHGTGLAPDEIEFTGNLIDSVRDCGIYAAGAVRIKIANNYVNGQTSTANGTIPKGGIAINGCQNAVLSDNTYYNCAINFSVVQAPGGNFLAQIRDSVIEGMPNNGISMVVSGSTGGNAQDIVIDGLKVQTAGTGTTGILVNATSTVGINNLEIRNFQFDGVASPIVFFAPDSSVPALGNVYMGMGKIRGASGTCLNMAGCTSVSQHILIEGITFEDMQANAPGLVISNVPGLTIRNILFVGLSGGSTYCWNAGGAQGRVDGVQYQGVAIANRYDSSSNRLGIDAPTFSGNDNDFIQNLSPTELGSTSTKYVVFGWIWDSVNAAWKQCRTATGN
jgi:hypothetical protein